MVTCGYCGQPAELVDSAEVYEGRSYGPIYLCRPCQAWVGVHPGTEEPLGTLARAELRALRRQAHEAFDPRWKGLNAEFSRAAAYEWLAGRLDLPVTACHIGQFDEETCRRAIAACGG